jgi:hypothetical protein
VFSWSSSDFHWRFRDWQLLLTKDEERFCPNLFFPSFVKKINASRTENVLCFVERLMMLEKGLQLPWEWRSRSCWPCSLRVTRERGPNFLSMNRFMIGRRIRREKPKSNEPVTFQGGTQDFEKMLC